MDIKLDFCRALEVNSTTFQTWNSHFLKLWKHVGQFIKLKVWKFPQPFFIIKLLALAHGKIYRIQCLYIVPCIKIFDTLCFEIEEKSHGFAGKSSLCIFCISHSKFTKQWKNLHIFWRSFRNICVLSCLQHFPLLQHCLLQQIYTFAGFWIFAVFAGLCDVMGWCDCDMV